MIDPNTAGTLAQVIAALLVMLALEEKLSLLNVAKPDVRKRVLKLREILIASNLFALLLCIVTMILKWENIVVSLFVDISVCGAVIMLTLMFAAMVGRDTEAEDVTTSSVAAISGSSAQESQ